MTLLTLGLFARDKGKGRAVGDLQHKQARNTSFSAAQKERWRLSWIFVLTLAAQCVPPESDSRKMLLNSAFIVTWCNEWLLSVLSDVTDENKVKTEMFPVAPSILLYCNLIVLFIKYTRSHKLILGSHTLRWAFSLIRELYKLTECQESVYSAMYLMTQTKTKSVFFFFFYQTQTSCLKCNELTVCLNTEVVYSTGTTVRIKPKLVARVCVCAWCLECLSVSTECKWCVSSLSRPQ